MSYVFENLTLRPLSKDDVLRTLAWKNDPLTRTRTFGYRFPVTEVMEEDWLAGVLNDQTQKRIIYGLVENSSGTLIGYIQLYDIDWISGCCMLGVVVGESSSRNKGLGTEAVSSMLKIGRKYFNLRKVNVDVLDIPQGALSFYEKLGFEREGTFRKHVYYDSDYYDVVRLSVFL